MLEIIKNLDQELFLFLNGIHNSTVDFVMYYITDTEFWFPFYLALLGFLIWKFEEDSIPMIIGVILAVGLNDLITSGIMKPYFERLRPCYEPGVVEFVHLIDDCGYPYGFASGHASNSFGIATFIWLIMKEHKIKMGWLFIWAGIVAYSRVYVGVHYPADIIVGMAIGIVISILVFSIYRKYLERRIIKDIDLS